MRCKRPTCSAPVRDSRHENGCCVRRPFALPESSVCGRSRLPVTCEQGNLLILEFDGGKLSSALVWRPTEKSPPNLYLTHSLTRIPASLESLHVS